MGRDHQSLPVLSPERRLDFMKIIRYFVIILSLLVLIGCSTSCIQNHIVAQTTVKTAQDERQYIFSIVHTIGSSTKTDKGTCYTGKFDLVLQNDKGAIVSQQSLNQFFGNKDLIFIGPVNLSVKDYNDDNFSDIPIGFPTDDGSNEYKYIIFSVGKDGRIFPLPGKGYKDEGFIYTAADSYSPDFITSTDIVRADKIPGILIGIAKTEGGFEPAKYMWNGKLFEYKKDTPFIIVQVNLNAYAEKYLLTIIQTEYKKPLMPGESGFNIFKSAYRGRFDLLIQDNNGNVTSRVSLNKYFGNGDLGFPMPFPPIIFKDYNKDGDYDFAIGQPVKDSPEFQYILLSVNPNGVLNNLPVVGFKQDGFIYSSETSPEFSSLNGEKPGIKVELNNFEGYAFNQGGYLWDGSKFVFSPGS